MGTKSYKKNNMGTKIQEQKFQKSRNKSYKTPRTKSENKIQEQKL
jgi:hypothetical protein